MINESAPFAAMSARATQVVRVAHERTSGLSHDLVATDDLLAALGQVRGAGARVLAALGEVPGRGARVEAELDEMPGRGARVDAELGREAVPVPVPTGNPAPRHLPFAAGVTAAIGEAARQAVALGETRIRTEHLLLGLLAATENAAYDEALAAVNRLRDS